jgi:hypothetical protein
VSDVRREQAAADPDACGSICALLPLAVEALPPVEPDDVVVSSLGEIATHLSLSSAAGYDHHHRGAGRPGDPDALEDARARLGVRCSTSWRTHGADDPGLRRSDADVLLTSAGRPASEVDLGPDAS